MADGGPLEAIGYTTLGAILMKGVGYLTRRSEHVHTERERIQAELDQVRRDLKKDLDAARSEVRSATEMLHETRKENLALRAERDEMRLELKATKVELAEMRDTIRALEERLAAAIAEAVRLRTRLSELGAMESPE